MANAKRDENSVPTLIAALDSDGRTIVRIKANSTNHGLMVDDGTSGGTMTLLDTYNEANEQAGLGLPPDGLTYLAQGFTNTPVCTLDSAKFYLAKVGSPTGNITAKIYALSGTYGNGSVPTGAALATSGNVDISTLTGSFVLKTFSFSGANQILLSASTNYFIVVTYTAGDVSNYLAVGVSGGTPARAGNSAFSSNGTVWTADTTPASIITVFYVYGLVGVTGNLNASRDENNVPVLLAVSSADGVTPIQVYGNSSGGLLIDSH